jgi:hypothetical protein
MEVKTMRMTAMRLGLGLAIVCALGLVASAEEKKEEKKEETLKGTICCTKCELGETKACSTAIKTKIDGKDVTVYFKDKAKQEPYHGKICGGPKAGSVTGVLGEEERDGKKVKIITPSKDGVKFD